MSSFLVLGAVTVWFFGMLHIAYGIEDRRQYAPSELSTATGRLAQPEDFYEASDCSECHLTQYEHRHGSVHKEAHHDKIYRAFAELACEEGGDELYMFCSSCRAPGAVATGEIPGGDEAQQSFLVNEGVTCDVCHFASEIRAVHKEAGANASLVLDPGEICYGPLHDPDPDASHESADTEVHTKSVFCSACHTLFHPFNGLVIEKTHEEWLQGPYASAGI